MSAGKGDTQRPLGVPKEQWDAEYERIFGRAPTEREQAMMRRFGGKLLIYDEAPEKAPVVVERRSAT